MKFTFNWVEEIDDGIICGQLSDDRYFIGFDFDDYDQDVWFFDEDPQYIFFADDGDPWEDYIDVYSVGELPSNQKEQFWDDAFDFLNNAE